MEIIKCSRCGEVHKFGTQKELEKQIIERDIQFFEHEKISAKMAEEILKRLKYPTNMIKQISIVIKNHMRTKQYGKKAELISDKALRKLKVDLGDHLEHTLRLVDSDNKSHSEEYNMPDQVTDLRKRLETLKNEPMKPNLPVSGNDIMKQFDLKPCPEVGNIMNFVKDLWMDNPKITKKQVFDKLKKANIT